MKKCALVLLGLIVSSTASFAAIIQVPWDSATQRYYLKWEGYAQINSGNYDPDAFSGTYQKHNGDKWIAKSWAANYGQWVYQFVGGPADNNVESVTVNVLCSQAGTANWHYGRFSTDATTWSAVYDLPSGQTRVLEWRGATFGSSNASLNSSTIYVRDTIYNGNAGYPTAVMTKGMEIIAMPVPEPSMIGLLIGGLVGMFYRRRKTA